MSTISAAPVALGPPARFQQAPLRIGIDAGPLLGEGGISRYVTPLVRRLVALDAGSDYRLMLRRSWASAAAAQTLGGLAPVSHVRVPDSILTWWWEHVGRTFPVHRHLWNHLDLFLATCLMAPVLGRGQVISIVYDLIPLRLPELFHEHSRFRLTLESLVHRSKALVAISEQTKHDLVELLGVDERMVQVIYPGRNEHFRPPQVSEVLAVTRRYRIGGPYVLYVGAVGPHKNVEVLLEAYQHARRFGNLRAKLVLVIRTGWGRDQQRRVESLGLVDSVFRLGPVPEEDLPALYGGAELFVFPSRYEGFGLPVLEAMACGTPVVVSDRGALPEVVGGAGQVVNADDPSSWAQALCDLANNQEARDRMSKASEERASTFSWTASARALGHLCHQVTISSR